MEEAGDGSAAAPAKRVFDGQFMVVFNRRSLIDQFEIVPVVY